MAKSLAELRRMPRNQLERVHKGDIIDSIISANETDDGALGRVETRLDSLFLEITAMCQSYNVFEEASNKKIEGMQKKLDKQSEIIMKQQMFLENIDRKERENNLVVFGISEDSESLDGATNDQDKLEKIWTKIGVDATRVSVKRLGRNVEAGKKKALTGSSKVKRD